MAEDIVTQHGIVAFLDILGYANFLKNNEPEDAAKTVLEVLAKVPEICMTAHLCKQTKQENRDYLSNLLKALQWLIFSDSILLTCPYPKDADDTRKGFHWVMSITSLMIVYRHLLDNGLPVRGGVSFGKFFVKDFCFAGRCIVAAHQIASDLDLAAIVLDDKAVKEIEAIVIDARIDGFWQLMVPYLVSFKGGLSKKMMVLPPSSRSVEKFAQQDIRQIVAESFWKHNKDITPSVLGKLNNTENLLRFMKIKFPELFAEKGADDARQ